MGVSLSGADLTFSTVRRLALATVALFCVFAYLYGPAVTPGLHAAAVEECNRHAQGNYRSFQLTWHVGVYPHWTCSDSSRPNADAISLGWWTDPF